MGEIGKKLRLNRIVDKTGRTVIIALDHGFEHGFLVITSRTKSNPAKIVHCSYNGLD